MNGTLSQGWTWFLLLLLRVFDNGTIDFVPMEYFSMSNQATKLIPDMIQRALANMEQAGYEGNMPLAYIGDSADYNDFSISPNTPLSFLERVYCSFHSILNTLDFLISKRSVITIPRNNHPVSLNNFNVLFGHNDPTISKLFRQLQQLKTYKS